MGTHCYSRNYYYSDTVMLITPPVIDIDFFCRRIPAKQVSQNVGGIVPIGGAIARGQS